MPAKPGHHVCIFGPLPPPYGGIATHVQRSARLLAEKGWAVTVFDRGESLKSDVVGFRVVARPRWRHLPRALRRHCSGRQCILHFHDIDWRERVAIGLLRWFGLTTVLTIHGDSLLHQLDSLRLFQRMLLRHCMRSISHVVAVNPAIGRSLTSLGLPECRVHVIPSYLPADRERTTNQDLPKNVRSFFERHRTVVCVSVGRLVRDARGLNLYGLDMCITLCAQLREQDASVGLIASMPCVGDQALLAECESAIYRMNLGPHVCLVRDGALFSRILARSQVFVRPTSTDGYGISVAESIALGIPTVASDVCERAPGCRCFPARDQMAFLEAVREALANGPLESGNRTELETGATGLIALYRSMIRE